MNDTDTMTAVNNGITAASLPPTDLPAGVPATAEEAVRKYSFKKVHEAVVYPEGGIYHIRAMTPTEKDEWAELTGKTKLLYDEKGEIVRDGRGNPVRDSALTVPQCLAFVKRFVGNIEKVNVDGVFINVTSPEFDEVLRHRGQSLAYKVELDEAGEVITKRDKQQQRPCKACGTTPEVVKVAKTETRYAEEEVWYWVIQRAIEMYKKNNDARQAALGNC